MKNYSTECVGTFFMVLFTALTANPIIHGIALVIFIYLGNSPTHVPYSPALAFAFWLDGKLAGRKIFAHLFFQLIGAALAGLLAVYLSDNYVKTLPEPDFVKALTAELLGSFLWTYTALKVMDSENIPSYFYGLLAGLAVVGAGLAFREISGGIINPAVAFGLCIFGKLAWADLWIYGLGSFVGASLAVVANRIKQ
jgi:glycerol uptake facilitator-like aquaporin